MSSHFALNKSPKKDYNAVNVSHCNTPNMSKQKTIALFYGSSTCYTEMTAEKIQAFFGVDKVDIFNVANEPLVTAMFYQYLIFGIPTWDYGELQEDWEDVWQDIKELDLQGKKVALFGLGDQVGYPEWFVDAMGYLHSELLLRGATAVGYWPNTGYDFIESKALTPDKSQFVGLPLDEESQSELSSERIHKWCSTLRQAFQIAS